MDCAALKAELAKPDYAGLSRAEKAAAINARLFTVKRPIAFDRVAKDLVKTGVYALADFYWREATNPMPLRVVCRTVVASIDQKLFADLDPDDAEQGPEIAAMLDGLQAAGCMTPEQREQVLARGLQEVPGSLAFLGRPLDESDIANAENA